jgi:predicted Zn-dependent peptidase
MKYYFFSSLILLFMSTQTIGQNRQIEFLEYQLDNGLTVILHQDNSMPIVGVSVMYHVGSKDEKPNRRGFAHFFEHLLFEGTKNIPRGEFFKLVERAGGQLNANTSYDRTFYYEVLPSNQMELGLWLESERMLHAKVDSIGIGTQKGVVSEEKKQTQENRPYGKLVPATMERMFTVHPYQSSVIGDMNHLAEASEQDYLEFYQTYYVPNNAILSIAGDFEVEEMKGLVEKYFGSIPKGVLPIVRNNIVEPEKKKAVIDTVYDNIQLPAMVLAYPIPAMNENDSYAVSMLTQVLSGGKSSRMYKSLVDEKQIALQAGSFPFALEDHGVALNFGIVNLGKEPDDLRAGMEEEIERLKVELISEFEFEKLRNQIENRFVSGNRSMIGIAESLANYKMYYGDANLINEEINRYMSVSREDIREAARKYFDSNNRVVLYYLPNINQ